MELVDLYDENRIPLGMTADRHGPAPKGAYRNVVHVCIFNEDGKMLIQRRTMLKKVWAGYWDVSVGGGVDSGETIRQGAERETREELGYPLDLTGVRASVTVPFDGGFDDYFLVIRDVALEDLVLQQEEVEEVRWETEQGIIAMMRKGVFVEYPESFISFLFAMRGTVGFPTK